ncbi:unnamed protein product [Brassica oleracea]
MYNVGPNGWKNCQETILTSLENKLDRMEIVLMCKLRNLRMIMLELILKERKSVNRDFFKLNVSNDGGLCNHQRGGFQMSERDV